MDVISEFFKWVITLDGVRFIAAHTVVNLVVAIAAALYVSEFKLHRLAEFLVKKLLPYVLVYAFAKAIGAEAGLDWLATAAFLVIEVTLAADLSESLGKLGIPLPQAVSRWVAKDDNGGH